jgi:hypothetical protein
MRTLNDYFIPIGNLDLGSGAGSSTIVACPDGGQIVGVSYNTTEAIDAVVTADILVNGADSGVDADFAITAVDTGGLARPGASLYVADHDAVALTPNAGATTGIVDCTLIIRR